jgi:hypothetical protein
MTCVTPMQRQDMYFHLLYGGDTEHIRRLIHRSVGNIAREYPAAGVREALGGMAPGALDNMFALRARFFMLLSVDSDMRNFVATYSSSTVTPFCPHKASRFYDELIDVILPGWIKNEDKTLHGLIDSIREAYLHS